MSRWFRMYDELLDDPKVQRLRPELFKAWVNLMCLASKHGHIPHADDVAFALRIDAEKAKHYVNELVEIGLIDITEEDLVKPHNWDKRQFKTDNDDGTNAKRQKAWRERNKQSAVTDSVTPTVTEQTVTITPPRTDTDTDTDKKDISPAQARVEREPGFDEFWVHCPRKVGKGSARHAYRNAIKKTSPETLAASMRLFAAKQAGNDPKFIPHPASWLNSERWLDDDLKPPTTANEPYRGVFIAERDPAYRAWEKHLGGCLPPIFTGYPKGKHATERGRWFDSDWPPQDNLSQETIEAA